MDFCNSPRWEITNLGDLEDQDKISKKRNLKDLDQILDCGLLPRTVFPNLGV